MMYDTLGLTGDQFTARTWIEQSALDEGQKTQLLTFIDNFADLTFYRDNPETLSALEAEVSTAFPLWFHEIREVLALVEPGQRVRVAWDTQLSDAQASADDQGRVWYTLDLLGFMGDSDIADDLTTDVQMPLYPIGDTRDTGESTLFVTEQSEEIFAGNLDDVRDRLSDKEPAQELVTPTFPSYAALLGSISAIKLTRGNEETIYVAGEGFGN